MCRYILQHFPTHCHIFQDFATFHHILPHWGPARPGAKGRGAEAGARETPKSNRPREGGRRASFETILAGAGPIHIKLHPRPRRPLLRPPATRGETLAHGDRSHWDGATWPKPARPLLRPRSNTDEPNPRTGRNEPTTFFQRVNWTEPHRTAGFPHSSAHCGGSPRRHAPSTLCARTAAPAGGLLPAEGRFSRALPRSWLRRACPAKARPAQPPRCRPKPRPAVCRSRQIA